MAAHDLRVPDYLASAREALDAAAGHRERAAGAVAAARAVVVRRDAVAAAEREIRAIDLVLAHLGREHERIGAAWLAGDADAPGALPLLDRLLAVADDAHSCAAWAVVTAGRVAAPAAGATVRRVRVRPGATAPRLSLRDGGRRARSSGSCRPGGGTPRADADGTH